MRLIEHYIKYWELNHFNIVPGYYEDGSGPARDPDEYKEDMVPAAILTKEGCDKAIILIHQHISETLLYAARVVSIGEARKLFLDAPKGTGPWSFGVDGPGKFERSEIAETDEDDEFDSNHYRQAFKKAGFTQ